MRVHQKMSTLENSERSGKMVIPDRQKCDHRSRPFTKNIVEITDNITEPKSDHIEHDAPDESSGSMRRMAEELPEPYREASSSTELWNEPKELANHLGISISGANCRPKSETEN